MPAKSPRMELEQSSLLLISTESFWSCDEGLRPTFLHMAYTMAAHIKLYCILQGYRYGPAVCTNFPNMSDQKQESSGNTLLLFIGRLINIMWDSGMAWSFLEAADDLASSIGGVSVTFSGPIFPLPLWWYPLRTSSVSRTMHLNHTARLVQHRCINPRRAIHFWCVNTSCWLSKSMHN